MRKYIVAAVLIGAFIAPAFAAMPGAGPYYVGLDTATHKCSVVTSMSPGMKRMGKYSSQARAERAMHRMNNTMQRLIGVWQAHVETGRYGWQQ